MTVYISGAYQQVQACLSGIQSIETYYQTIHAIQMKTLGYGKVVEEDLLHIKPMEPLTTV